MPNLSHILYPLNQLLQQNITWVWKSEHQKAFDAAKQMLSSDKALAHYDVNRPVKLLCDASAYGLGACLVHAMRDGSQKPIAYASRTLSKPERAYAQIECEGLALVFGVRHFHQYLYGRPFILVTDHRPLCKIFGNKQSIPLWLQHECRGGPSSLVHITTQLNISMGQLTTVLIACQGCHCLDNR